MSLETIRRTAKPDSVLHILALTHRNKTMEHRRLTSRIRARHDEEEAENPGVLEQKIDDLDARLTGIAKMIADIVARLQVANK